MFLRWSISCARMLEMALRMVDCTSVAVNGEGMLGAWRPPLTLTDDAKRSDGDDVELGTAKTRNRVKSRDRLPFGLVNSVFYILTSS